MDIQNKTLYPLGVRVTPVFFGSQFCYSGYRYAKLIF